MRTEQDKSYVSLTVHVLADQVSDFFGFWPDSERSIDEIDEMNTKLHRRY